MLCGESWGCLLRGGLRGVQDRMHLDCVFSIISDNVCIMMDEMMGKDSPTRRRVDEWTQDQVRLSTLHVVTVSLTCEADRKPKLTGSPLTTTGCVREYDIVHVGVGAA